jgi:hypothetical protein
VCKSLDSATKITGIALQALIVYTGYLIPPRKMVSTGEIGVVVANLSSASLVQVAHMGQPGTIRIRSADVERVLRFGAPMCAAKSCAGPESGRPPWSSVLHSGRESARSNDSQGGQLHPDRLHIRAISPVAELWYPMCFLPFLPRIDHVRDGGGETQFRWRLSHHF